MERTRDAHVHRAGAGYSFEAPGIYLWDEDRRAVERAAEELRRGNPRPRRTQRMLVIPQQEIEPPAR
jgi:hypothetical protein